MTLFALNLFDLADNDDYRAYSKRSVAAVGRFGGTVHALGRLAGAEGHHDTEPRQVMVLVEWPDREAFDAFVADPGHHDLHPLREHGTERYLWWLFDRLEDLRPIFTRTAPSVSVTAAERRVRVDPGVVWPHASEPGRVAAWLEGAGGVEVDGRLGQGQRHVMTHASGREDARVCELWDPQSRVRWRDLDREAWLEVALEPSAAGTTIRVEVRELDPDGFWTQERLAASLERLAATLDR
jgi:uncharacterized protein (DUF1330 family)